MNATTLVALALLSGACDTGQRGAADRPAGSHAVSAPATDTAAAHAHAAAGDGEPLLAIMQRLGTRMSTVTYGLMTDDTAMVAASAAAIAEHAPIAPDDLERIRGVLGTRMAEFERLDAAVHEASVRLHDAAAAGRTDEVLTRLSEVQRGCVDCHAQFRERLRTTPLQPPAP
jgi:cytochrome c556